MRALPKAFLEKPLAHRGLHDDSKPENSMAAMQAAVEAGYGIELDVQPSSECAPFVFHDETLDRMTDQRGLVSKRSSTDLSQISLVGGDGAGPPLLSDVLGMVAGRVPVLVEIKDQDGELGPNVGELERHVAAVLADYEGDIAVMSFNPFSVAAMKEHAPDIPRGLTTCAYTSKSWAYVPQATRETHAAMDMFEDVGAGFISHNRVDLQSPRVAAIKARGLPVLCWTIKSAEQETKAREFADNVTFEGYLP